MKKIIFGLSIIIAGLVLFIIQDSLEKDSNVNGIDEIFSEDNQTFDYVSNKFTVHGMGLSPEEKVMTVRIGKIQYKEQAEKYFRDLLDSYSMKSYELEVFVDDLSFYEKDKDLQ